MASAGLFGRRLLRGMGLAAGAIASFIAGNLAGRFVIPRSKPAVVAPLMVEDPKPFIVPASSSREVKPLSAWRRGYILKNHHQPPVAAQ